MLRDSGRLTPILALVRDAHAGQVDKQGRDYVEGHLLPVAALLEPFGELAAAAGLLHDIVEDTDVTLERLAEVGVPAVVVRAVDSVTKRDGEDYAALIARAAADPLGRLVKLADNWINLTGLSDLSRLEPQTAERLRVKYETAQATLTAALVG
jgi:(p)ppGpp synthase/HD superfamily hydrolase